MSFGGQTVTFVTVTDTGVAGRLGTKGQSESATAVSGCRHRPLTFEETAEYDTNVTTEMWKTTAPPDPAVLAAKSNDLIRVNGVTYQLIGGPRPHPDMDGRPFKVTLVSKLGRG